MGQGIRAFPDPEPYTYPSLSRAIAEVNPHDPVPMPLMLPWFGYVAVVWV